MIIDVNKVMNSPIGLREGWKEKSTDAFAGGTLIVPPGTQRVVMASMIDLTVMKPLWEISVMEMDRIPAMEAIARGEGGFVDVLGGRKAAWSPINAYFVVLDFNVLGTVWPANRQFAMRWAQHNGKVNKEASEAWWTSLAGTQDYACLIAVDLKDAVSPLRAFRRFQQGEFESLAGRDIDLKSLAELMATVQGLSLRVNISDKISGQGELVFTQDTGILKEVAKPLLLDFLGKAGAALEDFETWKFDVQPKKLVFKGDLSAAGFKRILSLIEPPMPVSAVATTANPAGKIHDPKAIASKRYFTGLCQLLDSIGKGIGVGGKAKSLSAATAWLARDARKIEQLPVLNVDDDLLAWSRDITKKISEIAQVFAVGSASTESKKATLTVQRAENSNYNYTYNYDYSNSGYRSNVGTYHQPNLDDQKRQATLEEREKAHTAAVQIWQDMTGKRPAMKQLLTKRYQIEF
jgi:hypothetical protein